MTGENRSWKNPDVSDSFREEQARKLAEAEARCRKATKAQKLALARKAETQAPGWLNPTGSLFAGVHLGGGADEEGDRHLRVLSAAGIKSD